MNALGRAEAEAPATTAEPPSRAAPSWASALAALGLGLLLLGLLFAEEGAAAVRVWNASTAYNHCWLVPPITAWLAWQRRHRLAGLAPDPSPALALLALPTGLAWFAAERLGVMEGRQFAALGLAEVLVLAVLGWRVARAMAPPLAYLVFLVPFGEFATPALQRMTAWMADLGLTILGITHYTDGLLIETTAGLFHVAEACAGLRFIVAALAFGALYSLVLFRSPGRRLAVMALALVVPVLANGVRALGIMVLAEYLGSAEAAAADHVVYGWGFFSTVILLLVLAGLPFREDGPAQPHPARPAETGLRRPPAGGAPALAAALLAVLGLAGSGPALAAALDGADDAVPEAAAPRLVAREGCEPDEGGAEFRCPGGALVSVRILVFPSRVTWRVVSAERRRLGGGGDDTDVAFTFSLPTGKARWQVRQPEGGGAVAVAAWLGGEPAGDGLRSRAAQAWNSLRQARGGGLPVVAAVELRHVGGVQGGSAARDRALLERLLAAQEHEDGLAAQAAALSGGRR